EAGIRDWSVTGVQTCALPIFERATVPAGRQLPEPDGTVPAARGAELAVGRQRHGSDSVAVNAPQVGPLPVAGYLPELDLADVDGLAFQARLAGPTAGGDELAVQRVGHGIDLPAVRD